MVKDFSRVMSMGLLVSCLFFQCGYVTGEDDRFTFAKTPNMGNELRLDGYYCRYIGQGQISVFFLFRNGNLLWAGPFSDSSLVTVEEQFRSGFYYDAVKDDKASWGIYEISSSRFIYEKWGISTVKAKLVYHYEGDILSDTSYRITSSERVDGTERTAINNEYHFKLFSPKPDSMVSFIP